MRQTTLNQDIKEEALEGMRKLTKALDRLPSRDPDAREGEEGDTTFVLYGYVFGTRITGLPNAPSEGWVDDRERLRHISDRAKEREEEGSTQVFPKLLYVGAVRPISADSPGTEAEPVVDVWEVPLPADGTDENDQT